MTRDVVTVHRRMPLDEIAKTLRHFQLGAVPVVDKTGQVVGIVTVGDLLRRTRLLATPGQAAWWRLGSDDRVQSARRHMRDRGLIAADAMTAPVATVTESASLAAIAELFERRWIRRVPVVRGGRLVGLVSRSDLLRSLTSVPPPSGEVRPLRDQDILNMFLDRLTKAVGLSACAATVVVCRGILYLRVGANRRSDAAVVRRVAEHTPGVRAVKPYRGHVQKENA